MFLKNWDMSKIYRANGATYGENRINRDKEVVFRYYNGNFGTSYLSTDTMYPWENGYYLDSPEGTYSSADYSFLWPGGDIGDTPARIYPGIEPKRVDYEDYNLYAPFRGGTAPGSGTIYGQPHVVSAVTYNEEKDVWERTVTREFKNISGSEITVRELGIFRGFSNICYAREILEEPIIVQDDSYFKLSFTWTVENPHENRKEKRIRAYSLPFYNRNAENNGTPHSIIPAEKKRMLLVRMGSIYHSSTLGTIESHKENFKLTLEGWTHENLASFYLDERTSSSLNHELTFVSIDLLTPDSSELNKISQPHAYNYKNYTYTFFGWVYLEDSVTDVSYENDSLIRQLNNPIVVQKKKEEKNIVWIGLNNPYFSSPWNIQMDENYCDFYYTSGSQCASFFFDQTDATEHSFNIYQDTNYEANAMVRLNLTLKEGEVLYKDVPVN